MQALRVKLRAMPRIEREKRKNGKARRRIPCREREGERTQRQVQRKRYGKLLRKEREIVKERKKTDTHTHIQRVSEGERERERFKKAKINIKLYY